MQPDYNLEWPPDEGGELLTSAPEAHSTLLASTSLKSCLWVSDTPAPLDPLTPPPHLHPLWPWLMTRAAARLGFYLSQGSHHPG